VPVLYFNETESQQLSQCTDFGAALPMRGKVLNKKIAEMNGVHSIIWQTESDAKRKNYHSLVARTLHFRKFRQTINYFQLILWK
jgi:hypothetical protein